MRPPGRESPTLTTGPGTTTTHHHEIGRPMPDQNEQKLRALELLQHAGERLTPFDFGTIAALRRFAPKLAARCDALERIEASRVRKRASRKPVPARRGPSVFDRQPVDDGERLLP